MGAFPRKNSGIQGGMNDKCEYSSALSPKLLVPSLERRKDISPHCSLIILLLKLFFMNDSKVKYI
jgi:hypothetical protein